MSKLIPINVLIGDRSYRLKIESEDEEMVRKTILLINNKILEFKTSFAGKDMQDYIAMVLLWFATEQNNVESDWKGIRETMDKLAKMEQFIDKVLPKNK